MKIEIEDVKKPRKRLDIGDIIQYELAGEIVNGVIIIVKAGEYRMLNLETLCCGSVHASSADDLFYFYKNEDNLKFYHKDEWEAKVILNKK